MKKMKEIEEFADYISAIQERVYDNFLLNFVAEREDFDRKVNILQRKYKSVLRDLPPEFFGFSMAMMIGGKIFQKNGLLRKYINHPVVKSLPQNEIILLEHYLEHPWKYAFTKIIKHPQRNFFEMLNLFTGEEYLLYSKSVESIFKTHPDALFFNLLSFNGKCWQTNGNVAYFNAFTSNDIFYYGYNIYPDIDDDDDLLEYVHEDPFPFMLLYAGAEYPVAISRGFVQQHSFSSIEVLSLDIEMMRKHFSVEWSQEVYRFSHNKWSQFPHFAESYYEEKLKLLHCTAFTKEGYEGLSLVLSKLGFEFNPWPDITVSPAMVQTMKDIYDKKFEVNSLLNHFKKIDPPDEKNQLDKINHLLKLLLPYFNSGTKPDLQKLAAQANLPLDEAEDLYKQLAKQFRK